MYTGSGASRNKIKGGDWIGMESTGRWSNGLGSLNQKCLRGGVVLFGSPPRHHCTRLLADRERDVAQR